MAGGGSSLTLPALILLGLDSATANGTNRISILFQNAAAVLSFRRRREAYFRESLSLTAWTIPGAVAGAVFAVSVDDLWFQQILAVVLIGVAATMFFNPVSSADRAGGERKSWWIYPALFLTGFYGGFIQVGVGFLFMTALYHLGKMSLIRVNVHKVFIILLYTIPALGVFIWRGKINWIAGLVLAGGSVIGGWWSAGFAVQKGERWIRALLVAAMILTALKLAGVF